MESLCFSLAFCGFFLYNDSTMAKVAIWVGELIAILSGKGGTGKTSLCAGIASALAQSGERILCIDCDVGLRNLDIALGISDLGALAFTDVCQGGYSLDQVTCHPVFPNMDFLTAPVGIPAEIPADCARMEDNVL